MRLPRFSLRDLAIATAIVSAGLGSAVMGFRFDAVGWKGLRTAELGNMGAAFVFFLLARFRRLIYKLNEDAEQMRLSVMYLVIAMTAVYFAIIGLMYD